MVIHFTIIYNTKQFYYPCTQAPDIEDSKHNTRASNIMSSKSSSTTTDSSPFKNKRLDDPSKFIKKYSLSFAEILSINSSFNGFLGDNIQSFESSDDNTNFVLAEAEDTRRALYEHAIWPSIELECKREETIIIENNLTDLKNEKDEEITAYSIFLSCILHYLMFLTPLDECTREQ